METEFIPGNFVRHPDKPEWGLGQVQSVVGFRITVTFQHGGKQLIDARTIILIGVSEDEVGDRD